MSTIISFRKFFCIFVVLTVFLPSVEPGGFVSQVYARGFPAASEALPEGLEDGTPFQQALKQMIADRASQGLPTPANIVYEIDLLDKTDQRTLVSGRTEIRFAGPEEAGYIKWPDLVIDEQTMMGADVRVQGMVKPGNYNRAIQEAVAARRPSIWNEYDFGYEPRTLIIWETYEVVGEGYGEEFPILSRQSCLPGVSTIDSVLFGFTYVGPDIHYRFSAEWQTFGVTIVRISLGFNLDWGMGLRFPFEVSIDSTVDEAIQGTTFMLMSRVLPQDWTADQYINAGAPAEEGKEFVLRFEFQASFRIWVIGLGDILNLTVGPSFNVSQDFVPPFYPPSDEFPIRIMVISPDETGLRWPNRDDYILGIGFGIVPHMRASTNITADWQAEADARGSGQIAYTSLEPVSVGPVLATDASLEDVARVRLSNFNYNFQIDYTYMDIGGILRLNIPDFPINIADFPIGRVDLQTFTRRPLLGVHPGTDGDVVVCPPVGIPLDVEKTADRTIVQSGESVTFTARVINRGIEPLEDVIASDAHCGDVDIGELVGGQIYEFSCVAMVDSDLGNSVSVTARGPKGEPYSDSAAAHVYVPDGVVGDGTPESCSEEALDVELDEYNGSVIAFNCGSNPHTIGLTRTKVIPRHLKIIGDGLITLDGQRQVRVIEVPRGVSLTLRGLVIANGWAHRPAGAKYAEGGGGIHNFGTLILEESTLLNNSADYGGGIHNEAGGVLSLYRTALLGNQAIDFGGCAEPCTLYGGDGGALYNASRATVIESRFSDNSAHGGGAIINWEGGIMVLQDNTILENNNADNGGALENGDHGSVKILNAILANNTAQFKGGAIANFEGGTITIDQSSLSANQSRLVENPAFPTGGGAIFNFPSGKVTLNRSRVSLNSSHYGAGVHNMGSMVINESTFTGNFAINDGGGAYNEGTMTVKLSTFGGSTPADGNHAVGGGALINWGPLRELTVSDSDLQNNEADNGGALENGGGGRMLVIRSQLLDNTAHFIGGGVVNYDVGRVELRSSSLSRNQAGDGGGLYNYQDGTVLVTGSSVISFNRAEERGGGIFNNEGTLTLQQCTIRQNQVSDETLKDPQDYGVSWAGGGIYNNIGLVSITGCTISENQAGYLGAGGGIYNVSGTFNLVNTRVNKNQVGFRGLGGGIYNQAGLFNLTSSTVNSNFIVFEGIGGGIYNLSGTFTLLRSTVSYNQSGPSAGFEGAGGIYNESGSLTIMDSAIVGNRTEAGQGGGINNVQGVIELRDSRVANNIAIGEGSLGGGIRNLSGQVSLENSTVTGNAVGGRAAGYGGGIYNGSGILTVYISDISNNRAESFTFNYGGGGIYNESGQVSLNRSSVTKNVATGKALGKGGGIYNNTGSVSLTNSTVSGNLAEYQSQGGGLYNASGNLTIYFSTVARNSAYYSGGIYGNALATSSIIAYNPGVIDRLNCASPLTSSGWNVESGHSCFLNGLNDLMDTNPLLNPLITCSGTRVHTLQYGSPAIDRIPSSACTVIEDQCGNPRPHSPGKNCDVGAYEVPQLAP